MLRVLLTAQPFPHRKQDSPGAERTVPAEQQRREGGAKQHILSFSLFHTHNPFEIQVCVGGATERGKHFPWWWQALLKQEGSKPEMLGETFF